MARIVVTHFHPDHLGGARWLQERSGAPVYMLEEMPFFHDLDGRIAELLRHHEERLDLMRRVIEDNPRTPYEVSRVLFRGAITVRQRCFALVETLAHLDHLVLVGRAGRLESGTVAYRAG